MKIKLTGPAKILLYNVVRNKEGGYLPDDNLIAGELLTKLKKGAVSYEVFNGREMVEFWKDFTDKEIDLSPEEIIMAKKQLAEYRHYDPEVHPESQKELKDVLK